MTCEHTWDPHPPGRDPRSNQHCSKCDLRRYSEAHARELESALERTEQMRVDAETAFSNEHLAHVATTAALHDRERIWRATDPRESVNKRASIIILRPAATSGYQWEAGTGYVDTKDGYGITTSYENHRYVGEDAKWDPGWRWTWAPKPAV